MRIRVYPEGRVSAAREYVGITATGAAAQCAEEALDTRETRLVVEPVDDEARALPGWRTDEDGLYRLFRATPQISWDVDEVAGRASP